jgi:hypothetical protein
MKTTFKVLFTLLVLSMASVGCLSFGDDDDDDKVVVVPGA